MEESLAEIREQEEEMSRANRALTIRLEDVQVRLATLHCTTPEKIWVSITSTVSHFELSCPLQRNLTKLSCEHKELEERLQEERTQKEQFKNMKNDIEDERRLLDRTVDKLQREVGALESGVPQ